MSIMIPGERAHLRAADKIACPINSSHSGRRHFAPAEDWSPVAVATSLRHFVASAGFPIAS